MYIVRANAKGIMFLPLVWRQCFYTCLSFCSLGGVSQHAPCQGVYGQRSVDGGLLTGVYTLSSSPRDGHWNRWYASYWNAFLLIVVSTPKRCHFHVQFPLEINFSQKLCSKEMFFSRIHCSFCEENWNLEGRYVSNSLCTCFIPTRMHSSRMHTAHLLTGWGLGKKEKDNQWC